MSKFRKLDLWQKYEYKSMNPGLNRISSALNAIGNPQEYFKSLQVAGTNGKGCTSAILASILNECGYKTGLFTSPHLIKVNERISVSGKKIRDKELKYYFDKYYKTAKKFSLTYFEFITLIAFAYFKDKKIDIAVLETGLGGRYDATNVVKKQILSIITEVSYDHTEILGKTLSKIAYEKAGIIKGKRPLVSGVIKKPARDVILKTAERVNSRVYLLNRDFNYKVKNAFWKSGCQSVNYNSEVNSYDLMLPLLGNFQAKNLALALKSAEILSSTFKRISEPGIRKGVMNACWPGRFQVIKRNRTSIIIDGAHNISGINALMDTLEESPWSKSIPVIFGVLKEKNYKAIIKSLSTRTSKVFLLPLNTPRSMNLFELKKEWQKYLDKKNINISDNIQQALSCVDNEKAVLVTGSLYAVSDALKLLNRVC